MDQKWTGTAVDRKEMRVLNLQQVVRRNFGTVGIFGFAVTLLCTWENVAISVGVALPNGGTAGFFWNYIHGAIGLGLVYASIAELGSIMPTAGGQYYWVAVLAPRSCRRYLSYITGWLCGFTWQTGIAGCVFIAGTLLQGLLVLNVPTYNYQRWHGSLLTLAFLVFAVAFNTVLARRLPLVETVLMFCHILGIVTFIPLLALSKKTEGQPIVDFYDGSGWMSDGVATLVGLSGPLTALIGFDCSIHMIEETKDSSRTVPYTLLAGYATNVLLGFFALMAIIYTIGDIPTTLGNAASGYPIINMWFTATQNLAGTDFMTAILIVNFLAAGIACVASASRQVWAFARNRGIPFSRVFAPDHLAYDIPLASIAVSAIMAVIIALINIGSASALGIIFSLYNSALLSSYAITITCILLHRIRGRRLPESRYSLGKWGFLINTLALLYIIPILIFTFFPAVPNPTPITMNWAIVMVGGTVILATVYYIIWGRKTYSPPTETIEDYMDRAQTSASEKAGSASAVDAEEAGETKAHDM